MFRRGGYGGRSKAAPDTLCQKCLKRGHYSYECTVSAQERPYKSRPSRTQQLLNPELKPKLTEDIPNDLLRKKGVADAILAQKEKQRGKSPSHKRSRSVSSFSSDSDSVSTISTNRSPSRSRSPHRRIENGKPSMRGSEKLGKRSRRSVSSASDSAPELSERHTRRRMSSFSPVERGRRRTRSRSSRMDMSQDEGTRRGGARGYRSRSRGGRRSRSRSNGAHGKRATRRLSPSKSPSRSLNRMDTSEDHNASQNGEFPAMNELRQRFSPDRCRPSRPRSRSRSPFRRRSPSPYSRRHAPRSPSPYKGRNGASGRVGRRHQFTDDPPVGARPPPAQPPPQRERSLSPYSKRVAMTRQMQGGH